MMVTGFNLSARPLCCDKIVQRTQGLVDSFFAHFAFPIANIAFKKHPNFTLEKTQTTDD